MKFILLGAPMSGKGTLAKQIMAEYSIPQISTGDIFRENIANNTPIGIKAKSYMDKGELVPDEITVDIVKDRLKKDDCKKGYILDGFPRTIKQAELLSKFAKVDLVVALEVPFEVLKDRTLGRRVCKDCGNIYNTSTYNGKKCECGGELIQRADDTLETITKRYEVYTNMSDPLKVFYKDKLFVVKADANTAPTETFKRVKEYVSKVSK